MKFIREHRVLFVIFLLALILRVIFLEKAPVGFHADEVRIAWNSYSIAETGADDWGNRFPLYYNTFGDFRPMGIFYTTIPSILLFGLNIFAVRLPGALFGALTVFPIYFFVKQLNKKDEVTALFASFFIAFIPWHWMVSRATSEGIISLFFTVCGLVFFLWGYSKGKHYFTWSVISMIVSALFYHSIRPLSVPFLLTILVFQWMQRSTVPRRAVIAITALTCFTIVLLLGKGSLSRFSQVSVLAAKQTDEVLGAHTQIPSYPVLVRDSYTEYFSAPFIIGDDAKPFRYRIFGIGIVGVALTAFFLAGFVSIAKGHNSALPLWLLLIAPLSAAITFEDSPNLHRSLLMIPFVVIVAAYGARHLLTQSTTQKIIGLLILCYFCGTTTSSIITYFGPAKNDIASFRNYGAQEVIQKIQTTGERYDHIVLTNQPDSLYPWYGFLAKPDARMFNSAAHTRAEGSWRYEHITFAQNSCPSADALSEKSDLRGNILVVDGPFCESSGIQIAHPTAKRSHIELDNTVFFTLWEMRK